MNWIAYLAGTLLVLAAATDVFLTVLYARSGTGLLAPSINRMVWHGFRRTALFSGRRRDLILSFCGPSLMVVLIAVWLTLYIFGFALIAWPALGSGITASQGTTATHFWNAVYYSGYTFTTLGTGDLLPRTDFYRMLMVLESILGFSFFTLTITYFLSVYNALRRRNTFSLTLHHKAMGKADASEYLASLGTDPGFAEARSQFSIIAAELSELLESHHHYPILHYFRFKEIQYAFPRIVLISMDAVSLAKCVLKEDRYGYLIHSSAAKELWNSGVTLLSNLAETFLSGELRQADDLEEETLKWRKHFLGCAARMKDLGIETAADLEKGAKDYITLRREWNPFIISFCRSMLYRPDEIIPFQS